ncbi:MAG: putative lipopolysaccharide heptosyltransferase [Proteobacteria bacterium]|nr:putative lipopolysaccharide heptosyltransferase [Pseudomonadota bacterium]
MNPASILLVITRRIGPQARIGVLVFAGTEGVLHGNPDIDHILTIPERPSRRDHFAFIRKIWRQYDLALSAIPGDRPTLYAWAAGRSRIGTLQPNRTSAWKTWLLDQHIPFDDNNTHTVAMALQVGQLLDIPLVTRVVPPSAKLPGHLPPKQPFAVLHPYPKFNYKMWNEANWIELAQALQKKGLQVLLTGGPDAAEVACCARIAEASGATSLAGHLSLGQTGTLLRQANLFVGPDTAVTHIAAATGIPTVALFGPTNPVKWGPWPAEWPKLESPWQRVGSAHQGNVYLLQGIADCVPCHLEGCEGKESSFSRCLQEIPTAHVLDAVSCLLAE